jgi:hypothetical protein
VEIVVPGGTTLFGVGRHANSITASLFAVLSAVNRAARRGLLAVEEAAARTGT